MNFAKPKSLKSLMRTELRRTLDFRISAYFAWRYVVIVQFYDGGPSAPIGTVEGSAVRRQTSQSFAISLSWRRRR